MVFLALTIFYLYRFSLGKVIRQIISSDNSLAIHHSMVKSISAGDSAALGLKYAPAFLGDLMEVLSISLVTGLTLCIEGFLEQTTKDLDDLEKSNEIYF